MANGTTRLAREDHSRVSELFMDTSLAVRSIPKRWLWPDSTGKRYVESPGWIESLHETDPAAAATGG